MSRGFVKEDDQEEIPIVPPRADLPEGAMNYVTQNGFEELLAEKERMISERDDLRSINEKERRITTNFLNAKLQLLNNRILTAKTLDLSIQPPNEIRFGAIVTLKINTDKNKQIYQIVGVDEADISKNKISFISPIAKLLTDKKVGDIVVLKLATTERTFEIKGIKYP